MNDLAKIEEICHAALEFEGPEREEFLKQICGVDDQLRREIESLLAFEDRAADFIEEPPADLVADLFAEHTETQNIIGKTLNKYRVLSLLGAGGMGEVYLAEDTKLGRRVAIKMLPPHFSEDDERKKRFLREARAISALNHPNIITVYGIEESGDLEFIITEFIDGQTLREKIEENSLTVRETLEIALQIASALESAHSVGIIHRDIKPANIMIRRDNLVKILDFGLAKLTADAADFQTRDQTGPNRVMGTINYMSPEQVLGEQVDPRTDIFSLGVVLYEMLSGTQPFQGNSDAAVYNATINKNPPPISEIKPEVPPVFDRIVRRTIEKKPTGRFQTATDLRSALQTFKENPDSDLSLKDLPEMPDQERPKRAFRVNFLYPSAVALAAISVSLLVYYLYSNRTGQTGGVKNVRVEQITEQLGEEVFSSLSADGKSFIYASRRAGNWDIYSQRVGGRNSLNLTKDSTTDDTQPALSVDGERIVFRSERDGGGIFVMGATGEEPRRISDFGYNPAWSPDGKEVAVAEEGIKDSVSRIKDKSLLWAINVGTGEKRQIGDFDAVQPAWSPNGKFIAVWTADAAGQRDIRVIAGTGGEPVKITDDKPVDWNPVWSPDGEYLYFASNRGGSMNLWRISVDERTGRASGEPEAVTIPSGNAEHFSFSKDGKKMLYVENGNRSTIQSIGFDPKTEKVSDDGPVQLVKSKQTAQHPTISPDGDRIAFSSGSDSVEDIFIVNKDGTGLRNLTDDKAKDRLPRWSPDGSRIVFYSDRSGKYEIWSVRPDGSDLRMVTDAPEEGALRYPYFSPDGKRLAFIYGDKGVQIIEMSRGYREQTPDLLPLMEGGKPFELWSWSPDGRFLTGSRHDVSGVLPGIYNFSLETREYTKLSDIGGIPIWLKDNRRLLFEEDGTLYLLDTKTGRHHEILSFPGNYISQFEISGDDLRIYYGIELNESDIWLADFQ
ncbi:MAG: protein kinase [Pyrinomonadaceae bacterium]